MTVENSLTFFFRHGSQGGDHTVPVIQSLLKKLQVLSGPREETSSDLRNNKAMGPIILHPAPMCCAKSIGFYWILVLILVKSTATSLKCMFNMFAAIFCFTCINFQCSSVLRSQEIKWNSDNVGKSLRYPSATRSDIVILQNKLLIADSITRETINSLHNACLLGTKRIFRTFVSPT